MVIMSMMVMGLMAVIAIALLAGAAFLFLKKRGGNQSDFSMPNTMLDTTNLPKTLAQHQSNTPPSFNMPTATPMAETVDYLAKAKRSIEQRDLNGAIETLKTGIKQNPNRGDLQILLLNTFAQAQDYKNFEQFYPVVLRLDDPAIINQANQLKKLVDEDMAMIETQTVNKVQPVVEDKPLDFDFDFDTDTKNTATIQSPTTQENSDGLSFDDFNFDTNPTSATTDTNDGIELETLSFDDFETTSQPPVNQTNEVEALEELDFDFNVTSQTTDQSPAQDTVTDEFDFDLSLDNTTTPVQKEITSDEFEFDLSLDNESASSQKETTADTFDFDDLSVATTTSDTKTLEADFDFNLDSQQPTVQETQESHDDLLAFDLALDTTPQQTSQDDIDFELDISEITVSENVQTTVNEPSLTVDEPSFTLDTTTPVAEPKSKSDELLFDDNVGFEEQVNTQSSALETSHQTDELLFDDNTGFDVVEEVNELVSTTAPTVQLSNGFEFIKSLDNSQLTLDLAEEYIQLGEYDSAKRLLEELKANAPTLQAKVSDLLEKIS